MSLQPEDFVNFTPHPLHIRNCLTGGIMEIPVHPGGAVRLTSEGKKPHQVSIDGGFEVWSRPDFNQLEGNEEFFSPRIKAVIVSSVVAEQPFVQLKRRNMYAPCMIPEKTLRDGSGRIIAISALHKYS